MCLFFFVLMILRPPRSTLTDTLFSLHDALPIYIGVIAAHHQDFAMRHVDDAHQPEAQREPHGGENVDRRDAEAVEDLSDEESGVHMVWPVQALSPPGRGRSCLETQAIVQPFPGKASRSAERRGGTERWRPVRSRWGP